jgi:hypothetical protein
MTEITRIDPLYLAQALAAFAEATPATCEPSYQSDLTAAEVVEVADVLGIDFAIAPFNLEDLQLGLAVEREQECDCAPATDDLPDEDLVELGKVAVAHLKEEPDYYTWLTQAHAPGDPMPLPYSHADVGTD